MAQNGNKTPLVSQEAMVRWLVNQGVAVAMVAYVLITLGGKLDQMQQSYTLVQTQLVHQTDIIAQNCK